VFRTGRRSATSWPWTWYASPHGLQCGLYLAQGGTNLRVCSVTLTGDHAFQMIAQKYKVSDELKTGTADDLFDYIALSISQFLKDIAPDHLTRHHSKDLVAGHEEPLYMGFTFSFPAQQIALNSGTLINWTKGFTATGAQGKDVVKLLQASLDKLGINVYVSALVNDTVGTMLSRAYKSGKASRCGFSFYSTHGSDRLKPVSSSARARTPLTWRRSRRSGRSSRSRLRRARRPCASTPSGVRASCSERRV
jgi:hexokinase